MDPEAVVSSGVVSICNFIDPNNVSFGPIDALFARGRQFKKVFLLRTFFNRFWPKSN